MAPVPSKLATKGEKKWTRALRALPLLLILYGAHRTFGTSLRLLQPFISSDSTQLTLDAGVIVPFNSKYFGISGLDDVIAMFTAFFTPSIGGLDPIGRLQAIAFLVDLIPLQVIWMVEGSRVGNVGRITAKFRTAITLLAQLGGIAYVAPIYCFLHYNESPLSRYSTGKERSVKRNELKTTLPTIGLTYIAPTVAMFTVPDLVNRQWINGVFFQPFPLYAAAVQRLLARFAKQIEGEGESVKDKGENENAYLSGLIKLAYGLSGAASAGVYLYLWLFSPVPMSRIFFSNLRNPEAEHTMLYGAAKVLRYDQICSFGAGAVWTLLHFWDLKRERLIKVGWGRIVGVFVGTMVVCGPGAGMAVMWGWRESVLRVWKPSEGSDSAPQLVE